MDVVRPDEFPYIRFQLLKCQKRKRGNPRTRARPKYKDIITAFDIETTRIPEIEQSVLYIWQWQFSDWCTVVGRTWEEFLDFTAQLRKYLSEDERLVVWVHNLSYEFQFLRGIYEFKPEEVFALQPRKILKASMWDALELRCSYLHSNMSLSEYCEKMHVEHGKLSGFDYEKQRFPWTELSGEEMAYCVHDVQGLVEALRVEMDHDGDNLYTIPLTSTGYVRRDAKRAMREVSHSFVSNQLPDIEIYRMLREAFRGGNTHASRFFAGQTVHRAKGADRSSSYPDTAVNCQFPVGPFFKMDGPQTWETVADLIGRKRKAVLCRIRLWDVDLRDQFWGCPYLSRDKCRDILGGDWDNGRILSADYLETTITDVDLRIIAEEYIWSRVEFTEVAYARYGRLPDPLVREINKYYRAKTELKGDPSQEIFYTKSKNKLNSIYGMMAQDPVKRSIVYTHAGKINELGELDHYPEDDTQTDEELLAKHNKRAFLVYQWGCWITAWARYRLEEGIRLAHQPGAEFLYCDTDSIYYLGTIDWEEYNRQRIEDSEQHGAYAADSRGEVHYMGVFELEKEMEEFRTLGAKKYVYTYLDKDGKKKLVCTVAGVGKKAGAAELEAAGGVDAFREDFRFSGPAGGLEAIYNDEPEVTSWTVEGRELHITSNVTLRPSSYTVGLSADYSRLLHLVKYTIDF